MSDLSEKLAADLALSCWVIEAARSKALEVRGDADRAPRVAERARILARACSTRGVALQPSYVAPHAEWMISLAGDQHETGSFGWLVLQRIGKYVEAHVPGILPPADLERLVEIGRAEEAEVPIAIAEGGLPEVPPPEWPAAPEAERPGAPVARIGLIGDTHIGSGRGDKVVPCVVEGLNAEGIDFSVVVGDVTQSGRVASFEQAASILGGLQAPWAATLGNHDLWDAMWEDGTGWAGAGRFRGALGREPSGIYEAAGARLIVVDSSDPTPSPFPPFDLVGGSFTNDRKETLPGGTFSDETAAWLDSVGPSPRPTFVFLHHPAYPYLGFPPLVFGLDQRSTQVLEQLVERVGAWGVICGHTHRSHRIEIAGVPMVEIPASKDWPFGYGILEVGTEGWAMNLRPIADQQVIADVSAESGMVFRRYARGRPEDRAFTVRR